MGKTKKPQIQRIQMILGLVLLIIIAGFIIAKWPGGGISLSRETITFEGHQKVDTSSSLRMTFPEKMDAESLKEHMDAPIAGDAEWNDNTLIFEPEEELEEGETYTFIIDRNAKLASGKPLNKDVEYRFTVAGPPALSSHYPSADAENIDSKSKIHLVFDRPIIPLSTVQGTGARKYDGQWPVTISPSVSGTWRWLGTTTIEFTPDDSLKPATRYTINVPKGITTVNGDKTEDDFSWSFETIRPQVVSSDPYQDYDLNGPDTRITLTFNQEMDLKKAIDHIRLNQVTEEEERIRLSFDLKYGYDEIDDEKKEENRNKLMIVPVRPLGLNNNYQVSVSSGIPGANGNLGSIADYTLNFSTVGDLIVEEFGESYRNITLRFSNPIDDETLEGNVSLTPEPEGWKDIELETSQWSENRDLYIYTNLKPSTAYKLTLSGKIKDSFGQSLQEPYTYEFTTEPLDPQLKILSNGDFGIFEKGRSPVYPFEAVNVSRIDIEMARVPFDQFIQIRKNEKEDWQFAPNLKNYIGYNTFSPKTENKLDEWETAYFDIEKQTGRSLIPGIYALTAQSPEYVRTRDKVEEPIISYQYFNLTNNALTLKYSGKKALVWLVSMKDGSPVAEADIVFYDLNGSKVLSGQTDGEGFFETDLDLKKFQSKNNEWDPEFWITASKNGDFTFLGNNWNSGLEPWNFGIYNNFQGPEEPEYTMDAYLYTERQLYRPGDTVYFKGIVRTRDKNGVIHIPGTFSANVTIQDANYNEIYNKNLNISEFGSFSGEIPVDPEAALGGYSITVRLLPEEKIANNYSQSTFQVLEYRKPEYKVEVTPNAEDYVSGDKVAFTVNGDYYFGAPMNDATVNWRAVERDYWFNRYTDGWYSFALEDSWCWYDCEAQSDQFTEGEGKLDRNGELEISFPVDLSDKGTSQTVTLYADVTDPNNQVVSNSNTVPVHKAGIYVGVRMEDYAVSPGEKAKVNVVTVEPDGTPKSGEKVTLSLYSREWNTIKKKNVDGYFYYENEPEDTFIEKETVTTGKDGKTTAEFLIKEGGSYRIVAEVKDDRSREAKAGTSLYAYSHTYINWPHSNNDRIEVIADQPEYAVGDTAKLLVKSPYQGEGVKALVTVERENVISRKVVDVESNAQPIEIPITQDLIPNAYVSVVIVKARNGESFDEEGNDTGMPAFKIGYAKLLVETEQKKLNLEVKTDKEKYGPGETVEVTIKSSDFQGNPVQAEVSLGVVDLSVQALLGFRMPDLIARFYENRGLGVQTSQMLTYLIEAFKPGSKGGGGGDAETKARTDFKDTAYWNPDILTDKNGNATLKFTLPDNLTTWQLLAIGNTKNHQYGAVVHEIIETKKTIVRPLRPRFAVEGDMINVGATVHNFTDDRKTFTVTLDGVGFEMNGEVSQELSISPDEMDKVIFPITINPGKEVSFHFKAQAEGAVDEITEKIPVYEFGTPQFVATNGVTEESVTETIYIPARDEARYGTITAIISPTLATYLPQGLEYLANFPYGCAEQTISSFLPNIALKKLQNFEAFEIVDDATLEKNIISGLEKLYNFQRGDGGFGYWSGSQKSYPYLTAYIVYGLTQTKNAGYAVDSNILAKANAYLQEVLRSQDMEDEISLTTRAYILFVLSENGRTDLGLLNNLYEKRFDLPVFARAYIAMAYGNHSNAKKVLQEIIDQVKIDARGAHFEEKYESRWRALMNTNSRTNALTLQAMVRIMPDHDLIPKLVRFMLGIREQGHWDTTQSTVASLFAFTEFLESTGELDADYTATVKAGDERILSQEFSADNILSKKEVVKAFEDLKPEAFTDITLSKEGKGRLYYDLNMDYFLTQDTIKETDQGIGITREITPLDEFEKDYHVQSTYKTKLTITVPEDRYFVAVASPLPAGFEPIDFTYKTSQQDLRDEVNQSEDGWFWWNPIWYFDHIEFRDEEIFLFADFLPAGVYEYEYLARATTAGQFRERPAHAWEMYYPETFGQTDGGWLEIKE
ncbi:Ig-like domain-containing protein [Candidatus Peregrinibacteria bacterium]|nr:Ig-like domain-containing protein [Candidatus Peregrinibacteria bacterium]